MRHQSESGRSMLEMIAVIIVMGILTILPLVAIRTASLKANVNNILQEVRKRAVMFSGSGAKRHASHPLTEGLFKKVDGTAPMLVSGYAIGDGTARENFNTFSGTRACTIAGESATCTLVYVPVGKYVDGENEYGTKISVSLCKQFALLLRASGENSELGDIIRIRNASGTTLDVAKCTASRITDALWLGIRIK